MQLPTRDWSSKSGAGAMAARLREHWRARGWDVPVTVVRCVTSHGKGDEVRHDIRSGLVSGMPGPACTRIAQEVK